MIGKTERMVRNALLWVLTLRTQVDAQVAEGSLKGKGVQELQAMMAAGSSAAQMAMRELDDSRPMSALR